jgi:hypothetical protein
MYITEPVTIKDIRISERYPYIRIITFKDRLYKIILASNELFDVGEEVLYIPDGTILPEYLLKRLGFWDYKYNHGVLAGANQNIVKAHLYARDPEYLSSGLILKAQNGVIQGFSDSFDIHTPEIDKKLNLNYFMRKEIAYLGGDLFFADVSVPKDHLLDIEYMHSQLVGKYVEYEELVHGRKFYITLNKSRSHHHACGFHKNIYITTDLLGKYRFLSNTKDNEHGNVFYRAIQKTDFIRKLQYIMDNHSTWFKLTFGVVLRSAAYNGHSPKENEIFKNTVFVDAYLGGEPMGRYLSQSEFRELCTKYNIQMPTYFSEGIYNINTVRDLLKTQYGVAVKATDGKLSAGAYSDDAKLRFIRSNAK